MLKSLTRWKVAFIVLCILTALSVKVIMNYPMEWLIIIRQTKYRMDVGGCESGADIYMLVLVGSHPDHTEIRSAIRQTWGNPRLDNYRFKLVFPFGTVANTTQQEVLKTENRIHGDILQGDFIDSYHNVTLRDLMSLKWALEHCPQARYIVHVDDDIALDIYKLIDNLEKSHSDITNLVACYAIIANAKPMRSGRWAVSVEEYPGQKYPDYCAGQIYVLTRVIVEQMLQAVDRKKFVWVNDVYITGMLVEDLSLKHRSLQLHHSFSYDQMLKYALTFNASSDTDVQYEMGPVQQNVTLLLQLQEIYKMRAIRENFIVEIDQDHTLGLWYRRVRNGPIPH